MKVKTKQTHEGWVVMVDGIIKFKNLTLHTAEAIANTIRLEIKNGVYEN